jgi:hypothetical protein
VARIDVLLQVRAGIAETRYVMPFVVALLIWFALSIPATLILGRLLSAASERRSAPHPGTSNPQYRARPRPQLT